MRRLDERGQGLASGIAAYLLWGFFPLLFPLLILSGMMLPLETGPAWMRVAALFNPLTYVVDAERVLFAGSLDLPVLYGALAAAATCAVGLAVGVRTVIRTVL